MLVNYRIWLTLEGYEGADGDYYFLWKEHRHGQNKYSHLTTDPKDMIWADAPFPKYILTLNFGSRKKIFGTSVKCNKLKTNREKIGIIWNL